MIRWKDGKVDRSEWAQICPACLEYGAPNELDQFSDKLDRAVAALRDISQAWEAESMVVQARDALRDLGVEP